MLEITLQKDQSRKLHNFPISSVNQHQFACKIILLSVLSIWVEIKFDCFTISKPTFNPHKFIINFNFNSFLVQFTISNESHFIHNPTQIELLLLDVSVLPSFGSSIN